MAHNFTYPDFSLIRHGFPTTLAKGVRIIEGPLYSALQVGGTLKVLASSTCSN